VRPWNINNFKLAFRSNEKQRFVSCTTKNTSISLLSARTSVNLCTAIIEKKITWFLFLNCQTICTNCKLNYITKVSQQLLECQLHLSDCRLSVYRPNDTCNVSTQQSTTYSDKRMPYSRNEQHQDCLDHHQPHDRGRHRRWKELSRSHYATVHVPEHCTSSGASTISTYCQRLQARSALVWLIAVTQLYHRTMCWRSLYIFVDRTRKPSWRKDYARQRRHSRMAAVPRWPSAAILDFIELQIAPFDPPTTKTLA